MPQYMTTAGTAREIRERTLYSRRRSSQVDSVRAANRRTAPFVADRVIR